MYTALFALASSLTLHCPSLPSRPENVYLAWNKLGDEGCLLFASLLRSPSCSLRVLDLTANGIGNKGALVIADALKRNLSLEELHLNLNNITDIGASVLLQSLETNGTLLHLNLSDNKLSDKMMAMISGIRYANERRRFFCSIFWRTCVSPPSPVLFFRLFPLFDYALAFRIRRALLARSLARDLFGFPFLFFRSFRG